MKGLRMVLTPFAPDQSGAVSVLYEMGGLIVILDAGGCTGNICGFDEPRWQIQKSKIMSAALRDMDAILGRDKLLVEKVVKAATILKPEFIALIGTPIPAVIGTDMKGLSRLIKKELNDECQVFGIPTFGMKYYDEGAKDAYVALVKNFVFQDEENQMDDNLNYQSGEKKYIGIFGAIPLDLNKTTSDSLKEYIAKLENVDKSCVYSFGLGDGIDALKNVLLCKKNYVVSRCGIMAAKLLKEKFDIEYEMFNPMVFDYEDKIQKILRDNSESHKDIKVLIVSEQIFGNSFRQIIREYGKKFDVNVDIKVAGYFGFEEDLMEDGDERFFEEDDFTNELEKKNYDYIITDPVFKDLAPFRYLNGDMSDAWIDVVHFAISGQM